MASLGPGRLLRSLAAGFIAVACALGACGTRQEAGRRDGAELVVAGGRRSYQNPAFSPDGRRLLFTRFERGYNRGPAVLVESHEGRERVLVDQGDHDAVNLPGSCWRDRIVFASDKSGREEVWAVRPGSTPRQVTRHETSDAFQEPSLSPDGEHVVFEVLDGATGRGSLWTVGVEGGEPTQLTFGGDDRQPNWSPVGDRVVFQRRDGDGWQLYTIRPDGAEVDRLTTTGTSNTDASWSPDGRAVVYSSDAAGGRPQVFVVTADGGRPRQLTHDGRYEDGAPSWSPDGRFVVFESHRLTEVADGPASVYRIRAAK